MLLEEQTLREAGVHDVFKRMFVDEGALVITPFQQAACRLKELIRGKAEHGTCGVGIGEAVCDALDDKQDSVRAAELADAGEKLRCQKHRIRAELVEAKALNDTRSESEWRLLEDPDVVERTIALWNELASRLQVIRQDETFAMIDHAEEVVFEGAQGVLLDQNFGFHPHTIWSDCKQSGGLELLHEKPDRVHRIGVIRSYMVRHGAGPFPTENVGIATHKSEAHNTDEGWQGRFRKGALDLVLLRYALDASGGVDGLALNCLDQVGSAVQVCDSYQVDGEVVRELPIPSPGDLIALENLGRQLRRAKPEIRTVATHDLVSEIESALDVPVWLVGEGPTAAHRRCTKKFPVSW
jgi:adenylosuccinate synthase